MRARYVLAAICIVISVASIYVALSYTSQDETLAATNRVAAAGKHPDRRRQGRSSGPSRLDSRPQRHQLVGKYEIQGVSDGYWWEPNHTSQTVVNEMVSKSLRALTGKSTDYAAWDSIFRYFNQQHGKGDVGYQPGEKIMIKVNFVGLIVLRFSAAITLFMTITRIPPRRPYTPFSTSS